MVSDITIPDIYLPKNNQIIPAYTLIENGFNNIGLIYVGADKKLHINGDTYIGLQYYIPLPADPNIGLPRGAVLGYMV